MSINTYNCVREDEGELCGNLVEADHKYTYEHLGIVYCDDCKAAGYVDGQLPDPNEQRLAESAGELMEEFLRLLKEE